MQDNRILIVDDEAINRTLIKTVLSKENYTLYFAVNGLEALEVLQKNEVDVILLDVMMPEMDGYETLRAIKSKTELANVQVIMITALSEKSVLKETLKLGADEFLNKPFDIEELKIRIRNVLKLKKHMDKLKNINVTLEEMVAEKTKELSFALEQVKDSEKDIIAILGRASEFRDNETGNHIQRMSQISHLLAQKAGLSPEDCDLILLASPMHDVGKIGIPDEILLKPSKLTVEEFEMMKNHTKIGYDILNTKDSPLLRIARMIALCHHEKWDGSGYPNGLIGEDIPIYARIAAISDVFDALMSERPYKKPFTLDQAMDMMIEGKGKHFDPKLVDLFIASIDEVVKIRNAFDGH